MRILLGGDEVCGYLGTYQEAFQKLGHEVKTAIYRRDPYFKHYEYDFYLNEYGISLPAFIVKRVPLLNKLLFKLKQYSVKKRFIEKEAVKFDVVIFLWRTFLTDNSDLSILKKSGCKIVMLFVGSEVRYNPYFLKKYDMSGLSIDHTNNPFFQTKIENVLRFIRASEKHADLIYSAPDMDGLQLLPYYHVQVPMNTNKYTFKNNERRVPVIIHAPSDPWKKGTDVIEKTLDDLRQAGVRFKYKKLQNIPNEEVLEFLMDADILVDELVFHGPATIAFEAMLCGCAVATRHLTEHASVFGPPVVDITPATIYDKLKVLIEDYDMQQRLIEEGRRFIEKNNEVTNLAQDILNNLENPKKYDYSPQMNMTLFNDAEKKAILEAEQL